MSHWEPSFRIEVENRLELLPPLLAMVESFCQEFGADQPTAEQVRLLAEEAVANAMEHAYLPGETGPVQVELRLCRERLILKVRDQGLPFDPDRASMETTDLGAFLGLTVIRSLSSRLEWHSLGQDGKELWVEIAAPWARTERQQPGTNQTLNLKVPRELVEVRPMHPADAEQVSQLAYRAYRLDYPNVDFYDPQKVLRLNRQEQLHSYVAVHADGVVAGHTALMRDALVQGGLEVGQVMVRHEFRGLRLANRLIERAVEDCVNKHRLGCFAHAVTAHEFSQKAIARAGLKSCACLVSYAKSEVFRAELADDGLQRESTLLMYRPQTKTEGSRSVKVYGAARLAPFADIASRATGETWQLTPAKIQPSLERNDLSVHEVPALATALVVWRSIGPDYLKVWRRAWEALLSQGIATAYVLLDWENSDTHRVSDRLFEEGFVPVGTLPGFGFPRPLILAKLAPQDFALQRLKIFEPCGKEVVAAMESWNSDLSLSWG